MLPPLGPLDRSLAFLLRLRVCPRANAPRWWAAARRAANTAPESVRLILTGPQPSRTRRRAGHGGPLLGPQPRRLGPGPPRAAVGLPRRAGGALTGHHAGTCSSAPEETRAPRAGLGPNVPRCVKRGAVDHRFAAREPATNSRGASGPRPVQSLPPSRSCRPVPATLPCTSHLGARPSLRALDPSTSSSVRLRSCSSSFAIATLRPGRCGLGEEPTIG